MRVTRRLLAQLCIAVVAAAGALLAVFRATQPRTAALAIETSPPPIAASSDSFPRLIQLYSGLQLEPGNDVDILLNGEGTYPRLWADLAAATTSITLQSYYNQPGAMADTLSYILRRAARRGVKVRLLLDAFGSSDITDDWIRELRNAGVHAELLRPLRWQTVHGAADRSHVRAIVIDGRIGYTGGFGFADYWQGSGTRANEWRETNVRVIGPAAQRLQAAFGAAWLEATGELLVSGDFFALPAMAGGVNAGVLFTTTTTGSTAAERFLVLTLAGAAKRLYITNSYFVPNADLRRLLADAVGRGVDVRILTAGPQTDVATTRYAGRYHYEDLLRAGVKIWEYEAAMMHAKTISIDGFWAAIGSMNFDNRSLAFNDEATLVVHDSSVAARLDSVFLADLGLAREVVLDRFVARSPWERLLEIGANLLAALL
jgi:cardiolipin synthase